MGFIVVERMGIRLAGRSPQSSSEQRTGLSTRVPALIDVSLLVEWK